MSKKVRMKNDGPIIIIAAVEGEVKHLKKQVEEAEKGKIGRGNYLWGKYKGKELIIAEAGAGISRARSATIEMAEKFSPRVIISTGSCGALKEGLNIEDVVIGDEIIHKQGGISERK